MKRTTTIVALAASAADWQQFRKDESNIGWTNYTSNTFVDTVGQVPQGVNHVTS